MLTVDKDLNAEAQEYAQAIQENFQASTKRIRLIVERLTNMCGRGDKAKPELVELLAKVEEFSDRLCALKQQYKDLQRIVVSEASKSDPEIGVKVLDDESEVAAQRKESDQEVKSEVEKEETAEGDESAAGPRP